MYYRCKKNDRTDKELILVNKADSINLMSNECLILHKNSTMIDTLYIYHLPLSRGVYLIVTEDSVFMGNKKIFQYLRNKSSIYNHNVDYASHMSHYSQY